MGGNQNTDSSEFLFTALVMHCVGSSVFSAGEVHCACPLFPSETSPKVGLDLAACLKWEA